MKSDERFNQIQRMTGIQKINRVPQKFTPMYVLGVHQGREITVSDMLQQIKYALRYIKANFDVNQEKYKIAIAFLMFCELRLNNQSAKKPNKRALHLVIDVFHEMQDRFAKDDAAKRKNEDISLAIDILIDQFARD